MMVPCASLAQQVGSEKTCAFASFNREFKAAMEQSDAGKAALMVRYPLRVNDARGTYYIKDAASLQGRFADIFTPALREAIAVEQIDASDCNAARFMYGRGDVWVTVTDQGYAIEAINVPGGSTDSTAVGRVEFTCKADANRIIVDLGTDGSPRFREWKAGHPLTQKPDTELLHGTTGIEGTGSCSYRFWRFKAGNETLSLEGLGCSSDSNPPPAAATGQFVASAGTTSWCF